LLNQKKNKPIEKNYRTAYGRFWWCVKKKRIKQDQTADEKLIAP
jgi:hypothetical protein